MKKDKQIIRILFAYSKLHILVDGNKSDSILTHYNFILVYLHIYNFIVTKNPTYTFKKKPENIIK